MRLLIILASAFFLFMSSAVSADEKADFSGRWSLNGDKTLVQGKRTAAQGQLYVSQDEDNLIIKRISSGRQGDIIVSEELALDGQVKDGVIGGKPAKSAVSWSKDGKKMTISSMILFAENDIRTVIEIWELSEGGKTLSIDYTSKSYKGARKATYVYDKK